MLLGDFIIFKNYFPIVNENSKAKTVGDDSKRDVIICHE